MRAPVRIDLTPHRLARHILWGCLVAELGLVLLDYSVTWSLWNPFEPLKRLCNFTREDSLPAWFGTTQTLLTGLTAGAIYWVARHQPRFRFQRAGWLFLAVFFVYMAIDDGAMIHERLGDTYQLLRPTSTAGAGGFPSYAWQILFVPFFAVAGLVTLSFLWRELRFPWGRIAVLAALSCWAVAVGLDFIEGLSPAHPWNLHVKIVDRWDLIDFTARHYDSLPYDTVRHFSKVLEEFLELFGTTLFWTVFLRRWGELVAGSTIVFAGSPAGQTNQG